MNTARYTYDMKTLAILAAIAAAIIVLMLPIRAHAKAQGDTIGAPTKEITTGTSRADMAEATSTPPVIAKTGSATPEKMTRSEERAKIRALKAELKRLIRLLEELRKTV